MKEDDGGQGGEEDDGDVEESGLSDLEVVKRRKRVQKREDMVMVNE